MINAGKEVVRVTVTNINKTDLAPLVGADLAVMQRDARAKRGELPIVFTSLRNEPDARSVGLATMEAFLDTGARSRAFT